MHLSDIKPDNSTPNISATDIIKADLTRHEYEGDITDHLNCIAENLAAKKSVMLRFSDTLFFCTTIEPYVFYVHLYTIDPVKKLAGAINGGIDAVKLAGVKRIGATTTNPQIIKLLKKMGYPVEVQQHENKYSWTLEINNAIQ